MTWLENNRLYERLEQVELDKIEAEMERDLEVEEFLNRPWRKLPQNYKYLLNASSSEPADDKTLLDLLKETLSLPNLNLFASIEDPSGRYLGFLALEENNSDVGNIKIFSIRPNESNTGFLKDVVKEFNRLIEERPEISWYANKDNPFTRHYIKAILKHRGTVSFEDGDKTLDASAGFLSDEEKEQEKEVIFTIDHIPHSTEEDIYAIFSEKELRDLKVNL